MINDRGFYYLDQIEDLDLNSTEVRKIKCVKSNPKKFNLEIPDKLKDMNFIKIIDFSETDFSSNDFSKLPKNIRRLNLEKCTKLLTLPETFKEFKQLKILNISKTNVDGKSLISLPLHLEELRARGCRSITSLPDSLMSLSLLEIVDIAGTYITGRDIENLSRSIAKLDASKCKKIVSITEKFKEFNHLQYLDLSKTSLETSAIVNFPDSLEVIDLAKSKIKGPVEFLGKTIREVNLDGTDVTLILFPNAQKELELLSLVMCSEVDKEKFVKTFSKKGDYIALKCLGIGRQQFENTIYVGGKERKKIEKAHRYISYEPAEWSGAMKHISHESRKKMGRCSLHYKNPRESK